MARTSRKPTNMQAAKPVEGPQPKTAVVVIHGIGEQRPLETLREFVETVYRRDHTLASLPVGLNGMLDISVVPDDVTGSAELRRITTLKDGPQNRTDFFEFYWADIMDGTPIDMVTGWIRTLLLRSPWRLPQAKKVKRAWLILLVMVVLVGASGLLAIHSGIAELIESSGPAQWIGQWLGDIRPYAGGFFVLAGLGLLLVGMAQARFDMSKVAVGPSFVLIAAGAVLLVIPASIASSLAFWAALVTGGVGWALNAVITPYAGDVVRYVRATPRTVERRRQVRERGMALLEALHKKRLTGPPLEAFTQANANDPPLYDRIVLVGHSLGTIIAYDILQLFWEKYGPTHHQDWVAGDSAVQEALQACDASVKTAWDIPHVAVDATEFEKSRVRLFSLLRDARPGWRISDLITLGSPLAHAEFLMVDSPQQVEDACFERRFATAPPRPDPMLGSMLVAPPGPNLRQGQQPIAYPHFAAQFAAVKWTNLYDEHANPLLGDLISGSLAGSFGSAIHERRVTIRRPGLRGALGRIFTHTQYWSWHPSYEADVEGADRASMLLSVVERQQALWKNVPDHIVQLRLALRLWSEGDQKPQ
ncbi:MAG: hypothetical protein JWQ22_2030 [Devosia sp.]|nr:hypothetical protein [Devosia sp.]